MTLIFTGSSYGLDTVKKDQMPMNPMSKDSAKMQMKGDNVKNVASTPDATSKVATAADHMNKDRLKK